MMNGIGIQFLDGINGLNIQFLDGTDNGIHGVFDKMREKRTGVAMSIPHKPFNNLSPQQQAQLKERIANRKFPFRRQLTPKLGQLYDFYTQGYTTQVADNIDTVLKGLDFAGFEGNGSIEDDEMLLNHLVRTKYIAEQAPMTIAGYQHPKMFNKMLGYVIDHWDTPDREAALDIVANEEERLIGLGAIIIPDHEDEPYEFIQNGIEGNLYNTEEYEVNGLGAIRTKTSKRGFFNQVRKLNSNAALTENARTLKNTVQNAFLRKKITKNRTGISTKRRKVTKNTATAVPDITPAGQMPEQPEDKVITQEIAETPEVIEGLGSTYDSEDQFNYVLQGYDLVGTFGTISSREDDLQSMKDYFENTRNLIANAPTEYFDSTEEAKMAIGALGYITMNWDNPITRDKVLGILAGEAMTEEQHEEFLIGLGGFGLGALDGKLKNFLKKTANKVKEKVKTVAKVAKATIIPTKKNIKAAVKAVKADVKKTVANIKKVAKKVGTAIKKAAKAVGKFIKKVVKVLIRFGPISLLAKGGTLIAMRLNMFKMAEKLYPGVLDNQEALHMGFRQEDIDKAKKAFDKTAKIYADRLQGSRKKLIDAIKKGAKKKWKGGETFNKAEMEAAANNMSVQEQTAAQAEMEAEKQEMIKSGAQFDNNNTTDTMSVQEYPNGIAVDVPAPEQTAVQGLQGLITNGYVTENSGLGFPPAIAAAATVVAAILGVISSFVGKKTAQIQANGQNQPAQKNDETAYVDEKGNPIPTDEYGNPVYNNTEEYSEADQLLLTQIATDPDALVNPVIQAALASNPALAKNPVVQTAVANKAATTNNTNTGISTTAKIGIGIGGILLLGTIAYVALSGKKEEVNV